MNFKYLRLIYTVTVLSTLLCLPVFAEEERKGFTEEYRIKNIKPKYALIDNAYFARIWGGTTEMLSSPLRWNSKEWTTALSVAGMTVAGRSLDSHMQNWVVNNQSNTGEKVVDALDVIGQPIHVLRVMAGIYTWGFLNNDKRLTMLSEGAIESAVVASLVTSGVKLLFQRARPSTGKNAGYFRGPFNDLSDDHYQSFPSGHATIAFATATVISDSFSDVSWVPWVSYGLASTMAMSRVYRESHWASDIILGSAIGYFTAKAIFGNFQRQSSGLAGEFELIPEITPGGAAVKAKLRL